MELTHFNEKGNAHMVNVTEKAETSRKAVATGVIAMNEECYNLVRQGKAAKGDVLGVARIAGLMGLKRTSELIPLCHNLLIEGSEVEFELNDEAHEIRVFVTVTTSGKTGVEMEAMMGAQMTLLTIYDMCKAADKFMTIKDVCLLYKEGGKSGTLYHPQYKEFHHSI